MDFLEISKAAADRISHRTRIEYKKNPDAFIILGECSHTGKKVKHHPDYDKPFEIELLCIKCHTRHHALIRRLKNRPKKSSWEETREIKGKRPPEDLCVKLRRILS